MAAAAAHAAPFPPARSFVDIVEDASRCQRRLRHHVDIAERGPPPYAQRRPWAYQIVARVVAGIRPRFAATVCRLRFGVDVRTRGGDHLAWSGHPSRGGGRCRVSGDVILIDGFRGILALSTGSVARGQAGLVVRHVPNYQYCAGAPHDRPRNSISTENSVKRLVASESETHQALMIQ
jgi:hypothetical protein